MLVAAAGGGGWRRPAGRSSTPALDAVPTTSSTEQRFPALTTSPTTSLQSPLILSQCPLHECLYNAFENLFGGEDGAMLDVGRMSKATLDAILLDSLMYVGRIHAGAVSPNHDNVPRVPTTSKPVLLSSEGRCRSPTPTDSLSSIRYSDDKLFEAALELLFRKFQRRKRLLKALNEVIMLDSSSLVSYRGRVRVEARVRCQVSVSGDRVRYGGVTRRQRDSHAATSSRPPSFTASA